MSEKDKSEPYVMPKPRYIGKKVHFYLQGDTRGNPCLAFTQVIDGASLDLAVLMPSSSTFSNVYAVRHVDDKATSIEERREYGGWDFIKDDAPQRADEVKALRKTVERLRDRVQVLEAFDVKSSGKPKG